MIKTFQSLSSVVMFRSWQRKIFGMYLVYEDPEGCNGSKNFSSVPADEHNNLILFP